MSLTVERRNHHRHRGYRGDFIPVHRAISHLEVETSRIVGSVALVVLAIVAWASAWTFVVRGWSATARLCFEILGVPASVEIVQRELVFGWFLDVPRYVVFATSPGPAAWSLGLGITALMLLVPIFLPDRARPIGYLLRLLAAVQVSSQVVFALFPTAFPYDVAGLTEVSLLANLFVIGLVPVIMGFAFFPLSYGWKHRIAAMLFPMLHLSVAVPLLYVAHAWILHHGSLLWMPLLFWAFGLVLTVSTIVAFYGWAAGWEPQRHPPRVRPRSPRPTWTSAAVLLVLGATLGNAHAEDHAESLQVGVDLGEYTEDLGSARAAFVAYTSERPWKDRWRFDLGIASRFEDTGVGIGASYGLHLDRNRVVTLGMSTGTGDVILPEWRADLSLRQTGLLDDRLILDVGYTHVQSKAENSTDGIGAGLIYALGRGFQIGVDGRVDRGNPGSTTSHSIAGSLLYGIWRTFYANVRYEVSEVAYVLVGPSDALVEFDSRGVRAGVTWYVRRDRGFAVEYSRQDTDFYDIQSIGLRAFTEW